MKTTIITFPNADFSQKNVGFLDLEPKIAWPAATLGAYRLKRSLAVSAKPKAGAWPNLIEDGDAPLLTYLADSVHTNGAQRLAIEGQFLPTGSFTLAVVSKRVAIAGGTGNQWLIGASSGSTARTGIIRSPSPSSFTMQLVVNGVNLVPLPPEGGERWDFDFAVLDVENGKAFMYRPRTGTKTAEVALPAINIPASQIRLGGVSGITASAQLAIGSVIGKAMTVAEMNALHASASPSLSTAGVSI